MANKHKNVDLGGMNVIVNSLKIASKPNQSGNAGLTLGASAVVAAGTGAGSAGNTGGAVATHVLPVTVGGVTYYIPLCNTNA